MSGQTLVIGFGITGTNAARHVLDSGTDPADLIVVDRHTTAVEQATDLGARAILGDGTDRHVLAQAVSGQIRHVIVAVVPDDAAVLTTMLARELCPAATIVTAVRDNTHVTFVRRHGADHAVTTSEAAGTALGRALNEQHEPVTSPWTIDQRPVQPSEIGRSLPDCIPTAVGILRGDQRHWGPEAAGLRLVEGDRIVFLRTLGPDAPH
jgi:voltage-gated potassium channel